MATDQKTKAKMAKPEVPNGHTKTKMVTQPQQYKHRQ